MLVAYAKVENSQQADDILQMEIARQNSTTSRAKAKVPSETSQTLTLIIAHTYAPSPPAPPR